MLHSTRRDTAHANETENDVDRPRIRGKPDIQASRTRLRLFLARSSACSKIAGAAMVDSLGAQTDEAAERPAKHHAVTA
jgi:hypothetical protein